MGKAAVQICFWIYVCVWGKCRNEGEYIYVPSKQTSEKANAIAAHLSYGILKSFKYKHPKGIV